MITAIAFIIILSMLILIHELGHFVAARRNGVLVEEFGLGIPPRLWGKKIGETIYSINALPFGGFVRLFGEDLEEGEAEDGTKGEENKKELNMMTHPRSFMSKKPWQRASILGAGVFMNIVLAIVSYYTLFLFTGFKTLNLPVFFDYQFKYGDITSTDTVVSAFSEGSPAEMAGIEIAEAIIEIDNIEVHNVEEVREAVKDKPNQNVSVLVKDLKKNTEDVYRTVEFTTTQNDEGRGLLGVLITESVTIHYPNKFTAPFAHSYNMLSYTMHTFGEFVKMAVEVKSIEPVSSGVSGPVGIYTVVGSILSYGGIDAVLGLIDFVALLSLSLALINIMPFPALDGGRLVFVLVEVIFRKPVSPKIEGVVHKWGMIFFLGLLLLVTVKDIRQFIFF